MKKILLVSFFILTIVFDMNTVSGTFWFYPDWPYRQMISITNGVSTPDDYQVKLVFDSSDIDYSKTNNDGSDLRFAYYNGIGEEEVNYWIESWDETGESIVWVKAPKIDGIYYVYYGNGESVSESNGENTFEFFDDFESQNLDKWAYIDGTWEAFLFEGNWVLRGTGSQDGRLDVRTDYECTNCVIESKLMLVEHNETGGYLSARGDINMQNHYASMYYGGYASETPENYHQLQKVEFDGTPTTLTGSTAKIVIEKWYDVELLLNDTLIKSALEGNGIYDSVQTSDNTHLNGYVGVEMWDAGNNHEVYFDDYRVRKYSFPEPTYTIGEMESPELLSTEVENLLTGSIYELAESFLAGKYVYSMITAWISNDNSIQSVNSNLSAPSGFLNSNVVPMIRIEEGEYSRTIAAQSLEIAELALDALLPWLQGVILNAVIETQPEIRWDYVIIDDVLDNAYYYNVDKKLPSILDGLPEKFVGRATMMISYCPVDMLVIDPEGKRAGSLYENGEFVGVVKEIEKSIYTGRETEPEFVIIFDPMDGEYKIMIYGNETGVYNLSIVSVGNGSVFYGKNYTNVSINQGEIQIYEEPITDIEPPEAVIGYDTFSEELIVEGKDNFEKDVSVTYEEGCSRRLFNKCMGMERNYTFTDDAGNQLVLAMRYNKINHFYRHGGFSFIHARLLSAKYKTGDGSEEIEYDHNWLSFNVHKQLGKVKHFSQNVYMKGRGFLKGIYESGRNQTLVINRFENKPKKTILEDLHIYDIITDSEEVVKIGS